MSFSSSERLTGEMAMTNPTDSDQRMLLAAAQAGDEQAFQQLIAPYRHALDVHCYRMLGSVQDAEDLAQETLLRAWRALDRFEPRAQFQTWLYRIATNACLDELARRPRRPGLIDPFPDRPVGGAEAPLYDPAARYAIREGMELALVWAQDRHEQPAALTQPQLIGDYRTFGDSDAST
jgi:RNA polymerase sigma-70 factor (ECF subfamily)